MKIIVQAGGLGTRMKGLTASKPKALIAVANKPILFHLFDWAGDKAEFIVIGDYKYDVLDRYLSTFASDRRIILVKAKGKGNVSGIREALEYIPENEPVMIVWSDLILPNTLKIENNFSGCQIGVVDFPCSWGVVDGKLKQGNVEKNGVAGLYVFDSKERLKTVPTEGSFTTWLASQSFPMKALPLIGCKDVGTLQAYQALDNNKYRCRPYNHIEVKEDCVVKTGLTKDAQKLIDREIEWYERMHGYGFTAVPKLLGTNPMKLERIRGQNLFMSALGTDGKRAVFKKIMRALKELHSFETAPASSWDLYHEYFTKTLNRLHSVSSALPKSEHDKIEINGVKCINVLTHTEIFRRAVLETLMHTHYAPIHGDCQLTNTLADSSGNIYFIDARGYFGNSKILGDIRYDWAKLYYAIKGNFDQFNVKNFTLDMSDDGVKFEIGSGGWEFLTDELFNSLPEGEGNLKEIRLIHAIIWLSMTSHVSEDFDSMCVAFYNGTLLFNEWLRDYSTIELN
jgi:GTP:adenosylcobinamide-phosphate guanylyltransferase